MITYEDGETDEDMDAVFHALAHGHRRRIMDIVKARPGLTVGVLAQDFDVSRIAIMNHLAVLECAGLVISQRDGRSRRLYLNAVPIQLIHRRWTTEYSADWARQLTDIKFAAEAVAQSAKDQSAQTQANTKNRERS